MKKSEQKEHDWTEVLLDVLIKILTLGFYHVRKGHQDPL